MRTNQNMAPKTAAGRWLRMASTGLALALILGTGASAQAPQAGDDGERNYDARVLLNRGFRAPQDAAQQDAVGALRSELPDLSVTYDEQFGVTRTLINHAGYLTLPARASDPVDVALGYVQANPALMGLAAADLAEYEVTDVVPNPTTGSTHVYVRQTIQGLSVYNAQLHVNVDRESRIMSVNNQFVPALGGSINAVAPTSSAAAAVARAAEHLAIALEATPEILEQASSIDRVTEVDPTGVSLEPITARLMFLPVRLGTVRLVWNFQIHTADGAHAYDFTVDADTGTVWTRFDWVASDQYVVYQQPVESPSHTTQAPPGDGRTLQFNPASATASPWGWHDTNGSSGAELTIPLGNNVHAYEDRNNSNSPPPASTQPDCGPNLVCNFGIDLTQAPSQYIPAAVTNLFYWNNIIHDIQ